MATMLRYGKFVRNFAGFARNSIFNSRLDGLDTNESVIKHSSMQSTAFTQRYASSAIEPRFQRNRSNLDQLMARLDEDVPRGGRINSHDIEKVLNIIRKQKTISNTQSLLMIRCCGNLVPEELPQVRTALAKKIWHILNKLNVPMDISHYNALLRVYLENEHSFSPTEFLADLEAKGIEPNRVTFQRLISRYCQEGDVDGATKILEYMKVKKLPVSEPVFNALIMGHSRVGNIDAAIGILPVMKQAKVEPTSDTYTILACGNAKQGNVDEILNILDKCEVNDIFLRDKDLMEIIYQLSANGHNDAAQKIIPRLRKSAGYNQYAVNVILRLISNGQLNQMLG